MKQLSEHVIAILRAIADGKQIQCDSQARNGNFDNCRADEALYLIQKGQESFLRIAPETRTINGVTFAAPVASDVANYVVIVDGYGETGYFYFEDEEDCAAARQAIIDALEGKTK